ncbi:MAG: hypothetical protein ACP5JU_02665 [Minisyncoccia bacterium]
MLIEKYTIDALMKQLNDNIIKNIKFLNKKSYQNFQLFVGLPFI